MTIRTGPSFTAYGWFLCLYVLIIPFQYGYHISVLNQIHEVLTCHYPSYPTEPTNLPTCIPMSDWTFSAVTAVFTVGGLLGSFFANVLMDRYGRKGAARASAIATAIGAGIMSVSGSVAGLGFGRFLIGIGAGVGICVGPIYIAEIAPAKISGTVGVFTQLAIVIGIFLTQLLGLFLATPTSWRLVLLFSFITAVAQILTSGLAVDTPSYIAARAAAGGKEEAIKVEKKIWGMSPMSIPEAGPASATSSVFEAGSDDEADEHQAAHHPLLSEPDESQTRFIHSRGGSQDVQALNLPTLVMHTPSELRKPLMIVCFAMLGQQLSGINAVLYYSNDILSKALPDLGPYVSLGITIVNVIMTFPPIFLIERIGRRSLLTISTIGAIVSLCVVGLSLDMGWVVPASVGILTFVTSFAIGLGPIPFLILPGVSPFYAVSALSSLALSLNWTANFLVAQTFLPVRNLLSGGDALKEGRVFFVFAGILAVVMSVVRSSYR